MTIREFLIYLNEVVNFALDNKIVRFCFCILMVYFSFSIIRFFYKELVLLFINQHAERDDINNLINSKEIEKNGKR